MNTIADKTRIVIYAYLLVLIAGLILQFTFSQAEISLAVNHYHNGIFDQLFRYGTYLADGVVVVIVSFTVMLVKRKAGWALLLAYGISALITQALKHWAFGDVLRPSMMLKDVSLHFVDGVKMLEYHSFPSGHSTSAFAGGTMFCLLTRSNWKRLVLLFLMLFACFTRIYLLQHFFQDTLAGSFVGFFTSLTVFYLMYRNEPESALI